MSDSDVDAANYRRDEQHTGLYRPEYFSVGIPKLVTMSFLTVGVYLIYWSYKNWQIIYGRETKPPTTMWKKLTVPSPITAALFSPYSNYRLFIRIKRSALRFGIKTHLQPSILTTVFVIAVALNRIGSPYSLISYLGILVFVPVQRLSNRINTIRAPELSPNRRMTGKNVIAILAVQGVVITILVIQVFLQIKVDNQIQQHRLAMQTRSSVAQPPIAPKASSNSPDQIFPSGVYNYEYGRADYKATGTAEIRPFGDPRTGNKEYQVSIKVHSSSCTGEIDGAGTEGNGDISFTSVQNPRCVIDFRLLPNTQTFVVTEGSQCSDFHGWQCGFSGIYQRVPKASGSQ